MISILNFLKKIYPHSQAITHLHVLMYTHVREYSHASVLYTCTQVGATHEVPPCPNPVLPEDKIMKSQSLGNKTEILRSRSLNKKPSEKSLIREERKHPGTQV
jgi:hypothetical protein